MPQVVWSRAKKFLDDLKKEKNIIDPEKIVCAILWNNF